MLSILQMTSSSCESVERCDLFLSFASTYGETMTTIYRLQKMLSLCRIDIFMQSEVYGVVLVRHSVARVMTKLMTTFIHRLLVTRTERSILFNEQWIFKNTKYSPRDVTYTCDRNSIYLIGILSSHWWIGQSLTCNRYTWQFPGLK